MIKSLHIKNFRSFPNCETVINFSEGINLIDGVNGSGKSTIMNALLWGIWGKCNYKKAEITNVSTNGECWVKVVVLLTGDIEMIIERTMKGLDIVYDHEKLSFPSILAANAFISKKVGMRYNVASFLMAFSGESCITSMTPAKRREIVEIVMGMDIIKEVNDKAKQYMNSAKANIDTMKSMIAGYQTNIENINNVLSIDSNEEEDLSTINENIESLRKEYEGCSVQMKESYQNLTTFRNKLMGLGNTASVLNSQKSDLINKANAIKQMNECPTCKQTVGELIKQAILNEYREEYKSIDEKWNDSKVEYDEVYAKVSETEAEYANLQNQLNAITNKVNELKVKASYIEKNISIKTASTTTIANIEKNIADMSAKLAEDTRKYDIMASIYAKTKKDAACILQVVSTHLDIISQHASNIIGTKICFNPDYTITATGRNMDISVLSSGEQKKIDFAIKLALLDTFMTTSSEIDVCFIDESLAAVDIYAICDIVKLLRKYTHHRHIGMYIVHHAQIDDTLFDSVLHVSKATGYSSINVTRNYIG